MCNSEHRLFASFYDVHSSDNVDKIYDMLFLKNANYTVIMRDVKVVQYFLFSRRYSGIHRYKLFVFRCELFFNNVRLGVFDPPSMYNTCEVYMDIIISLG